MTSAQDLMSQLQALQEKVNQLQGGSAAALSSDQGQSQRPESFTWAQLQQGIQNGEISEEQAQQIWANQVERRAQEVARQSVEDATRRDKTDQQFKAEVAKYHSKIPELKDPESAESKKVVQEAERLQSTGVSEDPKVLGLMALSRVYGPAEAIATRSQKEAAKDTHQEGTSGPDDSGDEGGDDDAEGSPPSDMPKDQRRYYSDLISKGIYNDWNAVKDELKAASDAKKRRRR